MKEAQNCAEERVDLAHRIAASTMELAKQMYRLSSIISPPLEKENDPLSACASRTRKASEVLSHIDTNILFSMNKTMVSEMNNDIFFQIEKKLFFVELAEKHQEKSPQNSDERKRSLLCYPPDAFAKHISKVSEYYRFANRLLTQALIDSTKAAKQKNLEKYNNILHKAAMHLHDSARLIEADTKDFLSAANTHS